MAYSYYGAQVNRHLCFSMVLSSALLIQHPVGIEPEIESSWESSAIRSKSDRNDVYRARSGLGVSPERRCWLLLYPKAGIPTGHAHWWLGYWVFPGFCSGFYPKHLWACPSLGFACWRPFCHLFTSSWGLDFFLLRVVEHHFFGMVGCSFIIARNLSPFNRIWMAPLYHPRPYNNNCLSIMAASTIV